jgi:hypothetical protein
MNPPVILARQKQMHEQNQFVHLRVSDNTIHIWKKAKLRPQGLFCLLSQQQLHLSCVLSNSLQQKKKDSDCIARLWTYCVCELPFFSHAFGSSLCSESIMFKYIQVKSDEDTDGCAWIGVPIGEYRGRKLYQGAVKDNTYFAVGACALMRSSETGSEPYIGRIIR